ncbi:MAG: hypothetical protein DIU60_017535 [Actinomycetes bacterium]
MSGPASASGRPVARLHHSARPYASAQPMPTARPRSPGQPSDAEVVIAASGDGRHRPPPILTRVPEGPCRRPGRPSS